MRPAADFRVGGKASRARLLIATTFGVPLLALLIVGTASAAANALRSSAAPDLTKAYFVSQCPFSHTANDDPIRFPGQPGKSHNHTFVGNPSTDANSTAKSLSATPSNCDRAGDNAAYWVPTVYAGGKAVAPHAAAIYYQRATSAEVTPFPRGFALVAGNQFARRAQLRRVTFWACGPAVSPMQHSTPPHCAKDRSLELHVMFPSCWDGRLEGVNDSRYVVYPTGGDCPSTNPISLPAITVVLEYRVASLPGPVVLASGGIFSGHADFLNAWDPAKLKLLVSVCLNEARGCGRLPPSENPGGPS
jgi:Domain of unknown function (DUF1996)